jgi:pyridoxine 4-dehydrogenase
MVRRSRCKLTKTDVGQIQLSRPASRNCPDASAYPRGPDPVPPAVPISGLCQKRTTRSAWGRHGRNCNFDNSKCSVSGRKELPKRRSHACILLDDERRPKEFTRDTASKDVSANAGRIHCGDYKTELRVKLSFHKGAALAGTIKVGDLKVNRLGFGAMRLCGDSAWGRPRDQGNANRVLQRAVELGVNFIDTADSYGPETNEMQIAQALYPYPSGLIIATKGGLVRPNRRSWVEDGRPDHLRRAVEGSLRRLRLERIDLYQLHAPDPNVPFRESVGALADLQRSGKIRHIGISNATVAQLEVARSITPIVSVQNEYNLRNKTSEDVLSVCERLGIAFLPWYPLGGRRGLKAKRVKEVASRRGLTHAALSLAWLLAKSRVMLPIPGTRSIDHLEDNVNAVALKLEPQDFDALR